jgi:hypothetical protein
LAHSTKRGLECRRYKYVAASQTRYLSVRLAAGIKADNAIYIPAPRPFSVAVGCSPAFPAPLVMVSVSVNVFEATALYA